MGRDNRGWEYYDDGERRLMGSDCGWGGRGWGGRGWGDDSGKFVVLFFYSIYRVIVCLVWFFGIFV